MKFEWIAVFAIGVLPALPAHARSCAGLSSDQIRTAIVQESRATYHSTGRPCACPDDRDRRGHSCGRRSAYSRPGGAEPKCYPQDVSEAAIKAYCGR